MNNKLMYLIASMFLLMVIMPSVSAELDMWNKVIIDETNSLVNYHSYYQFEDSSMKGVGRNKDIPIKFTYGVQALPYNLTGYGGQVDWCNLTINSFHNDYDKEGNLINTSTATQNVYFGTGAYASGDLIVNVKDSDNIIADMRCHYTNPSTLFVEHALIGTYTTYMPSFECKGCSDYTLEELTKETERNEQITGNELSVYYIVQSLLELNLEIWLIVIWFVKIFLLIASFGLVFSGIYGLYKFVKEISDSI